MPDQPIERFRRITVGSDWAVFDNDENRTFCHSKDLGYVNQLVGWLNMGYLHGAMPPDVEVVPVAQKGDELPPPKPGLTSR